MKANNGFNRSALKSYLKPRSHSELIGDIADLFQRFEPVQDYYRSKLSPVGDAELRKKYKEIIRDDFFPAHGFGNGRLSVIRKAVSDYRKASDSKEGAADVMLYFVEMGVAYTNEYGDINEAFYDSMESMYRATVEWIVKHGLQSTFKNRCWKVVDDTSGIGWGFHDGLGDIYERYFGQDESRAE